MFAINVFGGQPSGTAVFGNVTYAADLAIYRDQIYSHVALPGDVNFDGVVDVFDLNIISTEWKTAGPSGDANHDGIVDLFDLTLVSTNWTHGSPPGNVAAALALATAVPEPASALLIVVGAATAVPGQMAPRPSATRSNAAASAEVTRFSPCWPLVDVAPGGTSQSEAKGVAEVIYRTLRSSRPAALGVARAPWRRRMQTACIFPGGAR